MDKYKYNNDPDGPFGLQKGCFIRRCAITISKAIVLRIDIHYLDFRKIIYKIKIDPSNGKNRLIGDASPLQQVADYVAVGLSIDIFKRRIVPQQISSIPGRGPIYGTRMIQRWIDEDNRAMRWARKHNVRYSRKCKWYVKLDVSQCFPSLRVDRFMRLYKRDCANTDLLWFYEALLRTHAIDGYEGFMIGSRVSQDACQYMMSFIFRFAKSLHYYRRGVELKSVTHMLIQMDDILMFGSSRKELKAAVEQVIVYAKSFLGLNIKPNWQILNLDMSPVDIVGYKLYANGKVSIRSRIFLRARRMVLRFTRNDHFTYEQAKRLSSYKGYFEDNGRAKIVAKHKHSDSRTIRNKMELDEAFRGAQKIVSITERRMLYGDSGIHSAA